MRVELSRTNGRQVSLATHEKAKSVSSPRVSRFGGWAIGLGALALSVTLAGPASAQLNEASNTANQAAQEGAAAQEQIDRIDDKISDINTEYKIALDELEKLQEYNEQLEVLIEDQRAEEISLKEQIERAITFERDVVPFMNRMIEGLDEFVKLDMPFLPEERKNRVERLKNTMKRSDATSAEKFRIILEAYQIENEYGRTMEAYEGILDRDGNELTVNYLRVGRIAYVYQTLDGGETAVWDQKSGEWSQLGGSYREPINTAIRIAKNQLSPNLVIVPLRGPTQVNGVAQ